MLSPKMIALSCILILLTPAILSTSTENKDKDFTQDTKDVLLYEPFIKLPRNKTIDAKWVTEEIGEIPNHTLPELDSTKYSDADSKMRALFDYLVKYRLFEKFTSGHLAISKLWDPTAPPKITLEAYKSDLKMQSLDEMFVRFLEHLNVIVAGDTDPKMYDKNIFTFLSFYFIALSQVADDLTTPKCRGIAVMIKLIKLIVVNEDFQKPSLPLDKDAMNYYIEVALRTIESEGVVLADTADIKACREAVSKPTDLKEDLQKAYAIDWHVIESKGVIDSKKLRLFQHLLSVNFLNGNAPCTYAILSNHLESVGNSAAYAFYTAPDLFKNNKSILKNIAPQYASMLLTLRNVAFMSHQQRSCIETLCKTWVPVYRHYDYSSPKEMGRSAELAKYLERIRGKLTTDPIDFDATLKGKFWAFITSPIGMLTVGIAVAVSILLVGAYFGFIKKKQLSGGEGEQSADAEEEAAETEDEN